MVYGQNASICDPSVYVEYFITDESIDAAG